MSDIIKTISNMPMGSLSQDHIGHFTSKLQKLKEENITAYEALSDQLNVYATLLGVSLEYIVRTNLTAIFVQPVSGTLTYYNEQTAKAVLPVFDKFIADGKKDMAWPSGDKSPSTLRQLILQAKRYIFDFMDKNGYYRRELQGLTVFVRATKGARGVILKDRAIAVGFKGYLDRIYTVDEFKDWKQRLETFLENGETYEFVMKKYLFSPDDITYLKELEQSFPEYIWNILDNYLRVVNTNNKNMIDAATKKAQESLIAAMQKPEPKRIKNDEFDNFEKMFFNSQDGGMIE